MALTGKTIGQLALLSGITDNTLFAVEFSGISYNIPYSGFSPSTNYSSATYSELYNLTTGGTLTPGIFYLMTDYQACYDQPNYNNFKDPITTGNYMSGSTEPILLMSTSIYGFSPTVYSTLYPNDKITYDITWDTTEVTSSPAKGRITERIDNFNNRTDYDNRSVLFKRYNGYSYDEDSPLSGLVGISGLTGTTAVLYGNTGTTFNSNFTTGSIISVRNLNPSFFEVISVASDSLAIISGVTISETTDSPYYSGIDDGIMSYYQPNIRQDQVFEYTTFGDAIDDSGSVNNYIGNYSNLHLEFGTGDFLLANNVFLIGSIRNNTIGNGSYNNTFNDDCDNNQIGDSFYNNSTNDDFDGNIIGENFRNNYITSNFNNNRIGSDFYSNTLLGGTFYRNNIGNDFNNNVWTNQDFQNNEIGNQFNNNKIYNDFYNNDIGNGYNGNESYSQFYRNLIGNGYANNTIYSEFHENNIEHVFGNNTIGTNLTIGTYAFRGNRIGNTFEDNIIKLNFQYNNILNDFNNNTIYWDFRKNSILNDFNTTTIGGVDNLGLTFENNQIMNNFKGNNIQGNFWSNQLKTDFKGNEILGEFGYNNIGFGCLPNLFSGVTTHNNIGDYFSFNTCYGSFSYNTIGTGFASNEIQDGFGVGYGDSQGNRIGNGFFDNTIGEYFYNNTIPDNFQNNEVGDSFQWNIVNTYVDNIDFTANYGNISGITYNSLGTGATDNTYTSIAGTTNGLGVNATFNIVVSGGTVTGVTINNAGKLYVNGNTITILGSQIGGDDGVDNVTITVTSISQNPSVYEVYTCNIFKNSALSNRLSYYDASDVLTIKNINE
jgi:hypothetical protein